MNESNHSIPNLLDANSSGEFKGYHVKKQSKRSAFFGKENPTLDDESVSESEQSDHLVPFSKP